VKILFHDITLLIQSVFILLFDIPGYTYHSDRYQLVKWIVVISPATTDHNHLNATITTFHSLLNNNGLNEGGGIANHKGVE
jgi:hypothetical protein